jgi:hypothetical protein
MNALGKALAIAGGTAVAAGIIWRLYQQQAQAVTPTPPTPETHFECIKDPATGLIMCGEVEGAGVNQCDPYALPDACWDKVPCSLQSDCGTGARCWNGKCYWTANEYLDYEGAIVQLTRFTFEKRVVGNKILGEVGFKLNPYAYGCDPYLKIYLIRDGQRVKTVYNKKHEGMPTTLGDPFSRTDVFAVFMESEAVDGIEFEGRCELGFPWFSHCNVLYKVHAQLIFV